MDQYRGAAGTRANSTRPLRHVPKAAESQIEPNTYRYAAEKIGLPRPTGRLRPFRLRKTSTGAPRVLVAGSY